VTIEGAFKKAVVAASQRRLSSYPLLWIHGERLPRQMSCKRHILADTLGLLLGVSVLPANIQDRDGARDPLREARRRFPFVKRIFRYQGPKMAKVAASAGCWKVEIIKRSDLHRFVVLPKRLLVERSFAWISRNRQLIISDLFPLFLVGSLIFFFRHLLLCFLTEVNKRGATPPAVCFCERINLVERAAGKVAAVPLLPPRSAVNPFGPASPLSSSPPKVDNIMPFHSDQPHAIRERPITTTQR
jgi:transposase